MTSEIARTDMDLLSREVARRRTFAIISHPDAGKTTLTEKLLLYAGAVELAGSVRSRKNQRHATSDWMAMEQTRGISVTATALEMEYKGFHINLLDTPGHQDFSEDTYRTLMAADSAVMVLDSAKGIEPQTEKLFQVCRMRGIPILTFINKLDHPGRDPLDLLDEIERQLGISVAPLNWPIGDGPWFQGVYDLERQQVLRYQRTTGGQHRAPVEVTGLDDPALPELLGGPACDKLREDVELLDGAGSSFDRDRFLAGELTPVFFGSAINNFGVEVFLNSLLELAPSPPARKTDRETVEPVSDQFSGFIFKVQANMDPRHRDHMAFLRVCSGRFQRDMTVYNSSSKQKVRVSRAFKLFAREREPVEEAFPGDVVGVISPGLFSIGDTVTEGEPFQFSDIPRFPPEFFSVLINTEVSRYKQFHKGLTQLEAEGAVQVFYAEGGIRREPILGAVGELQFDVVLSRLRDEYGVEARLERMSVACVRWITDRDVSFDKLTITRRAGYKARDMDGYPVILFSSQWDVERFQTDNPDVILSEVS